MPKTKWWIRNFGVGKLDDQLQLNGSSIQPWMPPPTTGVTAAVTLWQLHPALDAAADHRGHGCRHADRYFVDLAASQRRSDRGRRRQLIRDAQSMHANARCDAVSAQIPTRQAPPPVSMTHVIRAC